MPKKNKNKIRMAAITIKKIYTAFFKGVGVNIVKKENILSMFKLHACIYV